MINTLNLSLKVLLLLFSFDNLFSKCIIKYSLLPNQHFNRSISLLSYSWYVSGSLSKLPIGKYLLNKLLTNGWIWANIYGKCHLI